MSGIYIDGISLGEDHWSIISKFFRAVVGPTDTTVEGRFVEERGKIWLILNGERHEVTPVPPHGRLIDADALAKKLGITDMDCSKCDWSNRGFCNRGLNFVDACDAIENAPTIIPAEEGE